MAPVFPARFMKGVGISVWQNSSDGACASCNGNTSPSDSVSSAPNSPSKGRPSSSGRGSAKDDCSPSHASNWFHYAKAKDFFGQKKLSSAWQKSNNFWELYETHLKLAKEAFGTNSFRFSFEWSRLEPGGPGQVDETAVERYHTIIDTMIGYGLEPMCTLHHFTHPQWFEDMGGFTKEENIPYFLDYCKRVFSWFGPKIKLWATFNEPTCFSFVGFIAGLWCPGKVMQFGTAGQVLFNLLTAHVEVYKALKAMPGGDAACIGLVHQHIRFMPKSRFTPHIKLLCKWMTYWFASDVILTFFKTGVFEWKVPLLGTAMRRTIPDAPKTLDWWGINYYSYPCVSGLFNLGASKDKEPVSDNSFRVYPQGLYDSIADASPLGVPIFVTETGSADKEGRHRRQIIEGHCSMIMKSLRDGYDVRGMYYWTLMDNIEWHEGFHMKFGLFEWDPAAPANEEMKLRLRPGSEALREAYRIWPDPLAEMRSFACDKHGWLAAQQLLRGGSGKVTASSPGSASAKIKNAWSDRDLCSKGDQEPPERTCSSPGITGESYSPDTAELTHALTTSSIHYGAPLASRPSHTSPSGAAGDHLVSRPRSGSVTSLMSSSGVPRTGSLLSRLSGAGAVPGGARVSPTPSPPAASPLGAHPPTPGALEEMDVQAFETDALPESAPADAYPRVWSTPSAITGPPPGSVSLPHSRRGAPPQPQLVPS